jgi:cyclopropane-fatty-acyl-phospholipid synthase
MLNGQKAVATLFGHAEIELNGPNPWDPKLHNNRFYTRLLAQGSLGLGESYMDGDWDCASLDQFFDRVISKHLSDRLGLTAPLAFLHLKARLQNRQSLRLAKQVATTHYDLPVEIFEATFDSRLTGSCAYWKVAETLDDAQTAKLDLVCRKIGLNRGARILDVGCGWGAFMGYAAQHCGAECVGITISPVQVEYARKRYAGLSVDPMLADYRRFDGQNFDHVVSMGMFEHVGSKNHRTFFKRARSHVKDDGLLLLHTIWENERYPTNDPWQNKYIYPNGDLPSVGQITTAAEGLFVVEDLHNFGIYYDTTLMAWNAKFQTHRADLANKYGERFCRMWEYYLLQCAGAFRARHISVGQIVLSPNGVRGGYNSIR